jgi:hypothetical protein
VPKERIRGLYPHLDEIETLEVFADMPLRLLQFVAG